MGIIADKIRQAIYGIDVREDIAQGIEVTEQLRVDYDQQVINAGNSNAEIVAARGGEVSLPVKINKIESSLSDKATKGQIIGTDFNIASDSNKLKLVNLSTEVISSIQGNYGNILYDRSNSSMVQGSDIAGSLVLAPTSKMSFITNQKLSVINLPKLTIFSNRLDTENLRYWVYGYDINGLPIAGSGAWIVYKKGDFIQYNSAWVQINITVLRQTNIDFADTDSIKIINGTAMQQAIANKSIVQEYLADGVVGFTQLDTSIANTIKKITKTIISYPSDFKYAFDNSGVITLDPTNCNIMNKTFIDVANITQPLAIATNLVEPIRYFITEYDINNVFLRYIPWSTNIENIIFSGDCRFANLTIQHVDYTIPMSGTFSLTINQNINTDNVKYDNVIIVAKSGGDFTSINSAVESAKDGDVIIVMPGIYDETVRAWLKEVSIIGVSKKHCILKRGTGQYANTPLEIGAGYVANMTIYADSSDAQVVDTDTSAKCYAVHVETDFSSGKTLEFNNCDLKSDWAPGLGVGLRPNFTLKLKNCTLDGNYTQCYVASEESLSHIGGLFFHDSGTSLVGDNQRIIIENCIIKSKGEHAIVPYCLNKAESKSYVTFYNTILWSDINKKGIGVVRYKSAPDGAWCGTNMYLTEDSFGNNVSDINS